MLIDVAVFVLDGAGWRILRAVSAAGEGLAVVAVELSRLSLEVVAMTREGIGLGFHSSTASAPFWRIASEGAVLQGDGLLIDVTVLVLDGAGWRILRAVSTVDDGLAVVAVELSRLSLEVVAMTREDIGFGFQRSPASVDEPLLDVEVTVLARAVSLVGVHSLAFERSYARSEAEDSVFAVEDLVFARADALLCVCHGVLDLDRTTKR